MTLSEQKKTSEDKNIVASNITYVVGQYHIYLNNNHNFLKAAVKKIFEFLNSNSPSLLKVISMNKYINFIRIWLAIRF